MRRIILAFALLLSGAASASAAVSVESAWVRATVPGQTASGAFMRLRSSVNVVLVSVSTPAAGMADLHQMSLEGGVMKMRALTRLPLPAGKTVELKSGGYHIMLLDLKHPLNKGDRVPLILGFEGGDRKIQKLEVQAEVRDLTAMPAEGHQHHH
jgi:copper(I)-binding protein